MVFGYLILFGIDVILSRLFLPSFSFNWEDRCTCVHHVSNTEDHIPSHFQHLKFHQKFSAVCYILNSSLYLEMWLNMVFHAWCITSLLLQLLFVTVLKMSEHIFDIFNLTSRICMGYPFHLWDALWSALKSLKTHYICNCLAQKHGLVFQN